MWCHSEVRPKNLPRFAQSCRGRRPRRPENVGRGLAPTEKSVGADAHISLRTSSAHSPCLPLRREVAHECVTEGENTESSLKLKGKISAERKARSVYDVFFMLAQKNQRGPNWSTQFDHGTIGASGRDRWRVPPHLINSCGFPDEPAR